MLSILINWWVVPLSKKHLFFSKSQVTLILSNDLSSFFQVCILINCANIKVQIKLIFKLFMFLLMCKFDNWSLNYFQKNPFQKSRDSNVITWGFFIFRIFKSTLPWSMVQESWYSYVCSLNHLQKSTLSKVKWL